MFNNSFFVTFVTEKMLLRSLENICDTPGLKSFSNFWLNLQQPQLNIIQLYF